MGSSSVTKPVVSLSGVQDGSFLQFNIATGRFEPTSTISAILKPRKGTAAEIGAIVLADGELAVTSDTKTIRLGDGATPGGSILGSSSALHVIDALSAGTSPTLTSVANTVLTFGTTSPQITLDQAGTYLLIASVRMSISQWDAQDSMNALFSIRRTNHTATALVLGSRPIPATNWNSGGPYFALGSDQIVVYWIYTTANTDDALVVTGSFTQDPDAGSIAIAQARLTAIKLF